MDSNHSIMMKVLMIGQLPKEAGGNYTTGAAKVVYELSKQSVEGIELHTFATNTTQKNAQNKCEYPNQYIGYKTDAIEMFRDIFIHPKKTIREWIHYTKKDHQNPLRYAFYKANIRRAIKLIQPDLIHIHSIGNVSPTRFACEGRHIPLLLTCHGIFYRGEANDEKGRDMYHGNLPLCDYYTGLTEEARHEFSDILGVDPERYTIIPNGVDSSRFYYSAEWRMRIRQEMGVGDGTIVFITVASLQERKGQLAFLKILVQLDVEFQYWLIGLGPDKEKIEEYASEHHISDKIRVLGYRNSDELYKYYSAADIYAHSSWKEGQALSEIEAYATGLRTIANKAVAGTLVGNPSDKTIYHVVDFDEVRVRDVVKWIRQTDNARNSRGNFDWKNIMERYAEVYNTLTKTL